MLITQQSKSIVIKIATKINFYYKINNKININMKLQQYKTP